MAENLSFSIGADTSGFHTGIGGVLTGLASLAAAFVSVQAVTEAFSQAIDMGGRLNDLSTQTGETAGNLAILERAFELNSVSADKLANAIGKMQVNLEGFAAGSTEASKGFEQLGLTLSDIANKSPIEQLEIIGIRLAAIQDPALRASTAVEIFGKSGRDLLPVLLNFGENIEQAKSQLGDLPGVLDRTAGSVDQLGDNLLAIRMKLTEMAYGFLSEVVPAINVFTGKLAGVNAAGFGVGLADTLIGAVGDGTKAAVVFGETLLLGAKKLGNELIYQVQYYGELFFNIFKTLGLNIIPMLGNNIAGAFEMAVGLLGVALTKVAEPFIEGIRSALSAIGLGDLIHPEDLQSMQDAADRLMVSGAAKLAESANTFQQALLSAQNSSTVVRQDWLGAEQSAKNIQQSVTELQAQGKTTIAAQAAIGVPQAEIDIFAPLTQEQSAQIHAAEDKVKQNAIVFGSGGMTAAQQAAAITKQLGLVAASGAGTAVGQAASAQRVIDLQKRLDTLVARGRGDTQEAAALATSINTLTGIALGTTLTSSDKEAARAIALDQWMSDTTQSFSELQTKAEADIQFSKTADATALDQKKKADAAGAGGTPGAAKLSIQGVAQAVLQILQKIEPKLPQHIMS